MNFVCLLNVPSKQQHFYLTYGKLVYCFHGESFFFRTKLTSRPAVSEPFISPGTREISVRKEIITTNILYVLHISRQSIEYISKRASRQAGKDLFS